MMADGGEALAGSTAAAARLKVAPAGRPRREWLGRMLTMAGDMAMVARHWATATGRSGLASSPEVQATVAQEGDQNGTRRRKVLVTRSWRQGTATIAGGEQKNGDCGGSPIDDALRPRPGEVDEGIG